jgi:transcriptional regulator with XRE-family HTH domain
VTDSTLSPETGEQTIHRLLATYDLARKLRQLRLRKKIALVDLGKHTGLSASMISQLETGKMVPTLQTLARIAVVFDVGLDYFFETRRTRKVFSIVRAGERLRFPERADTPEPAYFFECLAFSAQGKAMEAYLAEFTALPAKDAHEHFHEGSEFLFIVEGELVVRYQDEDNVLTTGDSVYFDASEAHSYRSAGTQSARAIVITMPPRL